MPAAPRAAERWIIIFLALGCAWRLTRYGLCFPFWGDESFLNINVLRRGYGALLEPLEYAQIAPLLFLWAQRTLRLLAGGGEYALRALPLAAGVGALLIFWRLARRQLEPVATAVAVGVFATTYVLVRHTCESKPYATDLLAATALLWAAAHWSAQPASCRRALATGLLAAVTIWLSYPAAFVAGGISLALLWPVWLVRSRRGWLGWAACSAAIGGSFVAFYLLFAGAQSSRAAGTWLEDYWRESFPPTHAGLGPFAWWLLKVHTGQMLAYPVGGPNFGSSMTAALSIIGAISLLVKRRGNRLALLLAPAVLTFIAALLHRYPYGGSARVAMHLAPMVCLLMGAGIAAVIDQLVPLRRRELARGAVGVVLVGCILLGLARDVLHPYKALLDDGIRRVVRVVTARIQPGDVVAVVNPPYGTYGPPDGPAFHQSVRYYLELYTGVTPRWCSDGPPTRDVSWLLAYRGPAFGPQRERVEYWVAAGGLKLISADKYDLSEGGPERLTVYRCSAGP